MTPSHVQSTFPQVKPSSQQVRVPRDPEKYSWANQYRDREIPSHWVWRGVLLICLGFWGFVIWAVSR